MEVTSERDIDVQLSRIREAARQAHDWISSQPHDAMAFLKSVKFEKKGFHPISHKPLNLIEQVNQTWTYAVALEATRFLLTRHPDAGGFVLAPGAHMSQELDIMSRVPGLVGAEVFAATSPNSNQKLKKDIEKLSSRTEKYRYVLFAAPGLGHAVEYRPPNKYGVQVWSLEV